MEIRTPYGTYSDIEMEKTEYRNNGNLAIQLYSEKEGPFATLTVNLNEKLPKGYAYVDTNNCPWAREFIAENHLGVFTGEYGFSGFCSYPLYRFTEKKETKKTGSFYTLIDYFDVWGNEKDGWEVNDQHIVCDDLYIDDDATDKEICRYLANFGYLAHSDMRKLYVEDLGDTIEVYKKKGMMPLCGLRRNV